MMISPRNLENIEKPDMYSLSRDFIALSQLEKGWFEPETKPLDRKGLLEAYHFLLKFINCSGFGKPYVFPVPDGLVESEWVIEISNKPVSVSLHINPSKNSIVCHASEEALCNTASQDQFYKTYPFYEENIEGLVFVDINNYFSKELQAGE